MLVAVRRLVTCVLIVCGPLQEKAEAAALWEKSRWAELETYILKSLDAGERSKLKLKNPLGIAHNLLNKYKGTLAHPCRCMRCALYAEKTVHTMRTDVTESRLQVLAKDITSIEHIEEQLEEYRKVRTYLYIVYVIRCMCVNAIRYSLFLSCQHNRK